MFGIGLWEIFGIVLVLLVFLRPADIPAVVRKLGRLYGRLNAMSGNLRMEIDRGLREAEREAAAGAAAQKRDDTAREPVARDHTAEDRDDTSSGEG